MERVVVRAALLTLLTLAVGQAQAADRFFSVAPCRLVDTRLADAPALSANVPRFFQAAGKCGIPADATALSMTVTSVSPTSFGHLIVYPGNTNANFTSALNFTTGQNRANHGIWKLGNGGFKVYAAGTNYTAHFVADVDGYFSSATVEPPGAKGPLDYHPVRECRVQDTRLGEPMVTGGVPRTFDVKGVCGIPELSAVAAMQLHAVYPNAVGHMKMWASDVTPGTYSNINISADALNTRVTTNGVFAQLGGTTPGDTTLLFTGYNANPPQSHVILDATGYFRRSGANAPGLQYVPMDGCRAVDTRSGAPISSGRYTYDLSASAPCTIPAGAKAVMANITILDPSGQGYLIAHAAGDAEPLMSTLNFWEHDPAVSTASIVRVDANARMEILPRIFGAVPASAHLLIDVFGYFVEGCDPAQTFCIDALSSAQVHPNTAKGGVANTPFHTADVDSINLFNGNLTINIPLGLTYPVGPSLRYGFGLAYNSNMWRTHESDGTPEPDQQFNAGMGWQMTHGRLYAPFSRPPGDNRWVYVGPDGSEHIFFEKFRYEDPEDPEDVNASGYQAQTWLYSRDNTFLRLVHKKPSTNAHFPPSNNAYQSRIEFPNGEIHFFDAQGRPVEIRDRFGPVDAPDNWIRFDYLVSGRTKITDSWGREHFVFHSVHSGFPQTIDRLEMASVGGLKNVVTFTYADHLIYRPCHNLGDLRVTVPLLQRVNFSPDNDPNTPNEWHYAMEDYVLGDLNNSGNTCRSSGALERLRLPTGGKLQWTYLNASFPQSSSTRRFFQRSNSVATRSTLTANNAVIGTWTYTREGATTGDFAESVTTLRDPLGTVTKSYFSVFSRGEDPVEGWSEKDYALPFTRRAHRLDPTDAPGLFLSKEVYEAGQTTPVRTTWVKYDRDFIGAAAVDAKTNLNARVVAERIVYEDDCESGSGPGCVHRYKSIAYDNWDTLGHFKSITHGGNFPSANYLLSETTWNPGGRPSLSEPWVLSTFSSRRIDAGGGHQSYERSTFDTSTGALLSSAVHFRGTATTTPGRDIVKTFDRAPGKRGFVTSETVAGGDFPSSFTKNFDWTCGALATSKLSGATYFDVDQTIDCSTGLVTQSRTAAGQPTSFFHDLTGRVTLTTTPGEADLHTSYVYATGSPVVSRVTNTRKSGAAELTRTETEYDELGRLRADIRQRTEITAGGSSTKRDMQRRTYDAVGNMATLSTWVDASVASPPTTRFQQYDAFGRAHRIVKADDSVVTVFLSGDFSRSTITSVGRSFSATGVLQQMGGQRTERYDRQGRLWKLTEQAEDAPNNTDTVRCGTPAGFSTNLADCNTDAVYLYDESDRLIQVSVQTDRGNQVRKKSYDPRGFLEWETHPELATAATLSDGTPVDVLYGGYNALGLPGSRRDASNRVEFTYDSVGRIWHVDEDFGGTLRQLKHYRYGTSSADRSNNRVVEAIRYNYRNVTNVNRVIAITETLQYGGVGGRMSSRTLRAAIGTGTSHTAVNGVAGNESFTTGFAYNNLGLVSRIDYPQCNFLEAQCGNHVMPPRSVNFNYRDGLLVAVPGFTGESIPGGGSGSGITYHPNGLWHKVAHASGAVYAQINDPDSLPRPLRYDLTRQGTTNSIGPFVYDDTGNVVKIGNEKHLYDLSSRVWKSQMDDGVNGQEFRYDGFGNILDIVSGVLANDRSTPTYADSNRLIDAVYDGAGRMIAWNGRQYSYDAASDLASETIPGTANWAAENWHYMYTADGERVWAFSDALFGRPRRDRWTLRGLNDEILREYYAENYAGWGNAKDYVWRNGHHLLSSFSATEGTRHYYSDHLRSVRLITDSAANSISYMFSFLPFGEQFSVVSPPAEPTSRYERHRFAGHERLLHDPASYADDLDYMHARHYNPLLGRFTSVDPADADKYRPQTWNRYAYVANNPLGFVDPDGRQGLPVESTVSYTFSDDLIDTVQHEADVFTTEFVGLQSEVCQCTPEEGDKLAFSQQMDVEAQTLEGGDLEEPAVDPVLVASGAGVTRALGTRTTGGLVTRTMGKVPGAKTAEFVKMNAGKSGTRYMVKGIAADGKKYAMFVSRADYFKLKILSKISSKLFRSAIKKLLMAMAGSI